MTKKMLHQEWNVGIDEAIEAEAQAQAICMQTEDFHRAYNAFVAKQKPKFEGNDGDGRGSGQTPPPRALPPSPLKARGSLAVVRSSPPQGGWVAPPVERPSVGQDG